MHLLLPRLEYNYAQKGSVISNYKFYSDIKANQTIELKRGKQNEN